MKVALILLILCVTAVKQGQAQSAPYFNTGVSLDFGFDGYFYVTPKITYGAVSVEDLSYINATISYSYSWSRDSFGSIYSEYGKTYFGIGAGISLMKKDGTYIHSFRGNVFGGAFVFLNYVYHSGPEFPDNIGIEFIWPLRYDEDAFKL